MATFQSLITSARTLLADVGGVRYSDADLLEYANEAVSEARRVRPDLFYGSYTTTPGTYLITDTVPLADFYHAYVKDYIVFRAEIREDEYANDGRAMAMLNRFRNGLLTV